MLGSGSRSCSSRKMGKTATRAGFVPSQRSPIEATKLTATRGPFWAAGVRHCHVAPVHDMDQHRRSPHLMHGKPTMSQAKRESPPVQSWQTGVRTLRLSYGWMLLVVGLLLINPAAARAQQAPLVRAKQTVIID